MYWDSVAFEDWETSTDPTYFLGNSFQEHVENCCVESNFYFCQSNDTLYAIYQFCGSVCEYNPDIPNYQVWPIPGIGYRLVKCDSVSPISYSYVRERGYRPSGIKKIILRFEE